MGQNTPPAPTKALTNKALGSIIREMRLDRNWMQIDLAIASQVDTSYISLLERFKRDPSLSITIRIATAFGLQPGEFVEMVLKRARHLSEK